MSPEAAVTTATPAGLLGYVRDQLEPPLATVGGFARMCMLAGKALFRRPFHWGEFIVQTWFITRVALLPTIAVSIPLTVLIVFTLNTLLAGPRGILSAGER